LHGASLTSRKEYFNEAAETWDQRFSTPKLADLLEGLVSRFGLRLGYNVLDVGTGTGVLIPFLLRVIGSSGSITAIDFAERMVQICRSKHSHIENVIVKLHDVEEEDLPTASFDAVTCFGLFPHLEKKEKALCNIYQALKPGGILIIAHALSSQEVKAHHNSVSPPVADDTLPDNWEMRRLLDRTGFTEINIEDEPGCYLCLSTKR
jgi:ubiquinone/menaquinone biosynthesis C-methylase UbiE